MNELVNKRRSNKLNIGDLGNVNTVNVNPGVNLSFDLALQSFLQDCKLRNLSRYTIDYYYGRLTDLKKQLIKHDKDTDPESITLQDIKEVITIPSVEKGAEPNTINNKLRAIRAFFNYLYRNGEITINPAENLQLVKSKNKIVASLTKEQVKILLNTPDKQTFTGFRDYMIMLLILETGIRLRELTDITMEDVNLEEGYIRIYGKNGSQRNVPLQEFAKRQLRLYIKVRGNIETLSLFISLYNQPLSRRQLQNRFREYAKKSGIKGVRVSCHTLRHTFAKLYIQNGGDAFSLRHILGHSSFDMVNKYVNMFGHEVSAQHRKFSPVQGLL